MINRRDLLSTIPLGTVAIASAAVARPADRRPARIPLGLQLYTVLNGLNSDLDGTLQKVAALGYREVETLGAFAMPPERLRAALDKAGLVSPSQHLMPLGLERDFAARLRRELSMVDLEKAFLRRFGDMEQMLAEAIGWAKTLGQNTIVWQIVWPSQLKDPATIKSFADTLNRAAALCAKAGLGFAFHNHGNEFVPVDGRIPYDMIIQNTDPDLVKLEMDVCWVVSKQADPVAYLEHYPGRYRLAHLKDVDASGKSVPIGTGVVKFPRVIDALRHAGVQHCYMELDAASDPFGAVAEAARKLKPLMEGRAL